jgi:hypothetical protein
VWTKGRLGEWRCRRGEWQEQTGPSSSCGVALVGDKGSMSAWVIGKKFLAALREKPLKLFEIMKRTNVPNEESCQSLLLKMRDEGSVKFDIHKGQWLIS